jgi:hypothetical protein
MFDWQDLLTRWSKQVIDSGKYVVTPPYHYGEPPAEVLATGWLGYAGASNDQIAKAETRLGTILPPSYREFLKVTNGWRQATPIIHKLWSTEEIEWFSVRNQQWIDAYLRPGLPQLPSVGDKEYFTYGAEQNYQAVRAEYMQTALEISDTGDSAIYLLNPKVVTDEGEWEAWFFANWLPGAYRYRSFWEMMESQYEVLLKENPQRL